MTTAARGSHVFPSQFSISPWRFLFSLPLFFLPVSRVIFLLGSSPAPVTPRDRRKWNSPLGSRSIALLFNFLSPSPRLDSHFAYTVDSRSNEIASDEFLLLKNKFWFPFIDNSLYIFSASKEILFLKNKIDCPLELVRTRINCIYRLKGVICNYNFCNTLWTFNQNYLNK